MMNFFAVISLIIGLLAGVLADIGEGATFSILNPYGFTFLPAPFSQLKTEYLACFYKIPAACR